MADKRQLEILQKGVQEWNRWRAQHAYVRPDLSSASLTEGDLRGADLSHADLSHANLSGAKLSDADLSHANLSRSNLSRISLGMDFSIADLVQADLSKANLQSSDLSRANLGGANLTRVDFSHADLSRTNISSANLRSTNFRHTNLNGTNLSDAHFDDTLFADVDLSQAEGLISASHRGPSIVGTNTLKRSRGQIPDGFLRGCGLSDWEIEMARLYDLNLSAAEVNSIAYELICLRDQGQPFVFYSAFISYAHEDQTFARALHDDLQGRGVRCWLDKHQMLPGDDIYDAVDRGIRLWDKVLLVCSENSLNSSWVEDEIDKALEKERKLRTERGEKVHAIIPLDLDGYLFDGWQDGRASIVRKRLSARFKGWNPDADPPAELDPKALDRVVLALRADGGGREPPPQPKI